ncbi:MAG TPA: PAS domain-containing protein [Candidatus Polarisedimenticolia bacterium]
MPRTPGSILAEVDAIYTTAPIGLCVIDRDLRYVRINEWLAAINGISAADHIGRSVREMVPALADSAEPLLRQVLETGVPILGLELHGQTAAQPDVQRIWRVNYVPLSDNTGIIRGINVSVEEITALRRLEEERARQAHLRALASHLQIVREEERTRIARELHDELGQALTAVRLGLQWVTGKTEGAPRGVRIRLDELDMLLETTMTSMRRIIAALRPPLLDLVGLGAAITESAKAFRTSAGIECTVTVPDDEPALPPESATALFRICQEALTNVSRHSGATRVVISLRTEGSVCILEVRDDGRGIGEEPPGGQESMGLLGMRERAAGVGGSVAIRGLPERGTTVTATVPTGSGARRSEPDPRQTTWTADLPAY